MLYTVRERGRGRQWVECWRGKERGEKDEGEGQTDKQKSGLGTRKETELGPKGKTQPEGRIVLEDPATQLLGHKPQE